MGRVRSPQHHCEVPAPARPLSWVSLAVLILSALVGSQAARASASAPPRAVSSQSTSVDTVTSAASFVNSVGVNVHMSYNDTGYADTARVVSLLSGLGVRSVRDQLVTGRSDEVAALRTLGQAGISSSLIVGDASDVRSSTVDQGVMNELGQLSGYVNGIEPANEYDCSGDPSWASDLAAYDNALTRGVRNTASLSSVPILGPAFCRVGSVAQFGNTGSAAIDYANYHDYPAGKAPEPWLEGRMSQYSSAQGSGLPVIISESGYTNATAAATQSPVSEATSANYLLRLVLDAARSGVSRTYLYELLDEKTDASLSDPEEHYGLVRSDGTPKPAYYALQNLLHDLARGNPNTLPTSGASTASFSTSVQGGGALLRQFTVEDPDGLGQTVALWLAQPADDPATDTVRLQVGSDATGTRQDPGGTNDEVALGTARSFDVGVSGAVTLIHLAAPTAGEGIAQQSCTAGSLGYVATANSYGAVDDEPLVDRTWSGNPGADDSAPDGVTGGVQLTNAGQVAHVTVASSPSTWTVAVWERSNAAAPNYSTFLSANGTSHVAMRTYDTTDDMPSHFQLSGYGAPPSGASYGTEMFGQAQPGSWHLVALTDDGSTATMSVDGLIVGTAPSSPLPLFGLDLGTVSSGFRGALAGLAVFPTALNQTQLFALATTADATCPSAATTTPTASQSPNPGGASAPTSPTPSKHHRSPRKSRSAVVIKSVSRPHDRSVVVIRGQVAALASRQATGPVHVLLRRALPHSVGRRLGRATTGEHGAFVLHSRLPRHVAFVVQFLGNARLTASRSQVRHVS